jgi:outer membrane cobalamin receptor
MQHMSGAARILIMLMAVSAVGHAQETAEKKAVELRDVVVTPTRTARLLVDVPGSVQVLDRGFVTRANPIRVDELFKHVVGVDLQGSGISGSDIKLNLRGLTPGFQSKRLLVLVDGRRFNEQFQGNAEFAVLPADSIERIEILRGPASALYGSNAMGGVINVVTRRGTEKPVTQLKAEAGSFSTRHYRASHGHKRGKVDYFVSGSHVRTDGHSANSDGTDRDWAAWNIAGNVGVALTPDSGIRLFLGGYRGEGTDENSEKEAEKDYQALVYKLQWHEPRDADLLVRVYRNGDDHTYDWKFPGRGLYDQETLGGEIQQSIWLDRRNRLSAGGEWRRDAVDIDEVTGPVDEDLSVASAYAQDELYLSDMLQVTAGVRYDDDSDFGGEWSPRLGALCRLSPAAEVFASFNRAHRSPGLSDRYVRAEFNGRLFEGNPDLQPETLTAYEAGIRGRINSRAAAEVAVFYNDLEGAFDFVMDPDGVFRVRNVTGEEIVGVEAGLRVDLNDSWSAFANYSYTDGTYDDFPAPAVEGNQLAYLAGNKAAVGIGYDGKGRLAASLTCRYVDKRYADAQNTDANRMDDYIVVDGRARLRMTDNAHLTLNVDNVFDKTYEAFPGREEPGFSILGGAEMTF